MKKIIFKYALLNEEVNVITMPLKAKILCVQVQNNRAVIWAMFNENSEQEKGRRLIEIYGTGEPFHDKEMEYVGTYQVNSGSFVGHVFDGGYVK